MSEDKKSTEDLIDELQEYLWEDDFADSFEKFAEANCDIFEDKEENKFEYTNIYKKFCALFEEKLEGWLKENGYTNEELYNECKKSKDEEDDNSDFIDILLALSDFDVFLQMMKDKKAEMS